MFSRIRKEFFVLMRFVETRYFSHMQCFDQKNVFYGLIKKCDVEFRAPTVTTNSMRPAAAVYF